MSLLASLLASRPLTAAAPDRRPAAIYIGDTDDDRGPRLRPSQVVAACPVLVERERELEFLGRVVIAVESGPSQLVVVTGEAGIGKSRLVEELVAGLDEQWTSAPLAMESGVPVAIGSLVPESEPAVVVLEDAERLDPAGIGALGSALDRLRDAHLLLLVQVRLGVHGPGSDFTGALSGLLRRPHAHEVSLGPLSEQGVAAMARALGHDLDDDDVSALFSRTAGNAFFSEEILLAPERAVPWTVTDAVMRRLRVLPDGAQQAANILAVAADPLPRSTLDAIVHDPSAVSALLDAGIARQDAGGLVALRHALVGEVVDARLAGSDRRKISETLATALEHTDVAPERLVRYWGDAGDAERAASYAVVAADRAVAGSAYLAASALYRVALTCPPGDQLARAELLDHAATAAGWAGLPGEAMTWATAADAAYREAGVPGRAIAMWMDQGLKLLPKPLLDPQQLPEDQIERLLQDARAAAHEQHHDVSAELARRALKIAADRGATTAVRVQAARRLMSAGALAEGEAHLAQVRATAALSDDPVALADVLGQLSIVAMGRNDFNECLALNRRAFELLRHGHETDGWTYEVGISLILAYMGELTEAEDYIDRLAGLGSPIITELVQLPGCEVDLERGDLDGAAARLDRLAAVTSLQIDEFTAGVLLLKARWALDSGDPTGALAWLAEAETVAGEPFETSRIDRFYWQARAAAVVDDEVAITAARDGLDAQVELGVGAGAEAGAAWIHGFVDARAGRHEEAARQFAIAATIWERLGRHSFSAEVWLDVAASLGACGQDEREYADALAHADEIAGSRGLTRILARRDTIATSKKDGRTRRPGDLTAREREIAELVGTGKTNREIGEQLFLSEHTVRNQLVHIFDKLGVSRRAELAALVAAPDWPAD